MNREEVAAWVHSYIGSCIDEELPSIQGVYAFGHHTCGAGKVLACEPELISNGRKVSTLAVDDIIDYVYVNSPQVLDATTFAIYCSGSQQFAAWHSWNIERGMFSL